MAKDLFDDEARAKAKVAHAVGEPLDDLSVRELDERIVLLRAEIERLETTRRAKRAASDHAGSIFRS